MAPPKITDWRVKLFLQLLLFLGGAGAGIGFWSGYTYVLEPTLEPPDILKTTYKSTFWDSEKWPILNVDVYTNGIGKIAMVCTYIDENNQEHMGIIAAKGHSDYAHFKLKRDMTLGYSKLEIPAWIKHVSILTFRGDWDGKDLEAPHKTKKLK